MSSYPSSSRKQFSFKDYDVIGFDLDFTLIRWNITNMTPLIIESLQRFLIERKFYPTRILEFEINIDFMQKGLILDTEKGNLLKLGNDGSIVRATHGTSRLTQQQISDTYGEERKWDLATTFLKDPLSMWDGPLSLKVHLLLDYFDLVIGWLFAQLIDLVDTDAMERDQPKPHIYRVFPDILAAITDIFCNHNFYDGHSFYFRKIRAEPQRYMYKTSATVIKWLKDLRKANKCLALITGSQMEFADFAATYAIGHGYQALFDIVVFRIKKPAFFAESKPFVRVEDMMEVVDSGVRLADDLELNHPYIDGNWPQIMRTFAHKIGKSLKDLRSLYVGDNHLLDVFMPKKYCGTDTAAICEELIAEQQQGAERDRYADREYVYSHFWGSYFNTDNCPTYWMEIISHYSKICSPFLEYLAEVPTTHIFITRKPGGFYV